jgi:hypothetical protein
MAIFIPEAERKDLLQVQEAAGDFPSLFAVNGFNVVSVILRLLDGSVRIAKNDFACRGTGENLPATIGREREGRP